MKVLSVRDGVMEDQHRKMMNRAIALARRGIGKTSPNPAVGCVIAREGVIVGEGWHRKAGTPHAEVHALRQAGGLARGADVYVTLEPCAHHGKTPPCAEALIAAGVGTVRIGMIDPNPLVKGEGIGMLRAAGITVETGLLEGECRKLNEPFIKFMTSGLPFVVFKSAMTLDGKTSTVTGDSKWITNEMSRSYVHKLRAIVDAVMVGVGTVVADDPLLTCRSGGKNPVRVIVDSTLRIPLQAQVLQTIPSARTIIATIAEDGEKTAALGAAGAEIIRCKARDGKVDLLDMFEQLARNGIYSVLLEGGGTLAGEALRLGLIDKFLLFYAPLLIGGNGAGPFAVAGIQRIAEASRLCNTRIKKFGSDFLLEGYPEATCLQD